MTEQHDPPARCDVVVIGGGPAGSSVAALLAKAGIDVVLLERAQHPRPAVGESLIPHCWRYLDQTGATDPIERENFLAKAGGITVWNGKIHRIAFADFGFTRPALHVERDRFDHLLFQHAAACGTRIFERVAVKRVDFDDRWEPTVLYHDRRSGSLKIAQIRCRYVVDASGPATLLAHQFGTKRLLKSHLRFLSMWGYFRGSHYLAADGERHAPSELPTVRPVTFVTSFADGWIWHIPLRHTTSVGLVIHSERTAATGKAEREALFLQTCRRTPYLAELLAGAEFEEGSLSARPDYSYYTTRLCGETYYQIGDAASFVDPIYSHGVLNAFYNAVIVAWGIRESLRNAAARARHAQLCENRIRQFYGFSRSLALGNVADEGLDERLVQNLMRAVPARELELMLAAASMSDRAANFRRLADNAGLHETAENLKSRVHVLERLVV